MTKYNEAALRGWVLLRCTPVKLCEHETIEMITRALATAA